jgi:hypothetical protein
MVDYSLVLTGLGLIVAITYYSIQIRNQNRTRQAQMFMQMYNRFTDSISGTEHLEILSNSVFSSVSEYNALKESDADFNKVFKAYAIFYEALGVLVKEGLLDVRFIALMWGGTTRMYWEKIVPIIEDLRDYYNYPRNLSETEYVCKEVIKYMKDHPELQT